jgi:hypothetical protein
MMCIFYELSNIPPQGRYDLDKLHFGVIDGFFEKEKQ